jgi:hypothetical protein
MGCVVLVVVAAVVASLLLLLLLVCGTADRNVVIAVEAVVIVGSTVREGIHAMEDNGLGEKAADER